MLLYILNKYWKGTALAVLFFIIGYATTQSFNESMFFVVCMGFFVWMIRLIVLGKSSKNGKKAVAMAGSLVSIGFFILYVVTLKPLRSLIRRLRYGIVAPKKYPFLALYGSVSDTYAMMTKFSYSFFRDKTSLAKAILWRLVSTGSVMFGVDGVGRCVMKLGKFNDHVSDGIDHQLEQTMYRFLRQAQLPDGTLMPQNVRNVIAYSEKKNDLTNMYDHDNQYRFADLLNMGIGLKAYTRREIRNIYGMKRFLKTLPSSFEKADFHGQFLSPDKIWTEYMTYAYLFGTEKRVLRNIGGLIPPAATSQQMPPPVGGVDSRVLLTTLRNSTIHWQTLQQMMTAVANATPMVEDAVAGRIGLLPIAWHVDEVYDI